MKWNYGTCCFCREPIERDGTCCCESLYPGVVEQRLIFQAAIDELNTLDEVGRRKRYPVSLKPGESGASRTTSWTVLGGAGNP